MFRWKKILSVLRKGYIFVALLLRRRGKYIEIKVLSVA
jgi:hypothetical protein